MERRSAQKSAQMSAMQAKLDAAKAAMAETEVKRQEQGEKQRVLQEV
jgi:hypothetical protein